MITNKKNDYLTMKINLTQLFIIFDELLPLSNAEQGIYWFKASKMMVYSLFSLFLSMKVMWIL